MQLKFLPFHWQLKQTFCPFPQASLRMDIEATLKFLKASSRANSQSETFELTEFDGRTTCLDNEQSTISSSQNDSDECQITPLEGPNLYSITTMNETRQNDHSIEENRDNATQVKKTNYENNKYVSKYRKLRNLIKNTSLTPFQIMMHYFILFPVTLGLPFYYAVKHQSLILRRPYFEAEITLLILSVVAGPLKDNNLLIPMFLLLLIGLLMELYMEFMYIFFAGWVLGKVWKFTNVVLE